MNLEMNLGTAQYKVLAAEVSPRICVFITLGLERWGQ